MRRSWCIILLLTGVAKAEEPGRISLMGDFHRATETPIVVECPALALAGPFVIKSDDGRATIRGEVFQDGPTKYLGAIVDHPAMGNAGTLAFSFKNQSKPTSDGVELSLVGQRVSVRIGGKLVTEYVPDDGPKPYFYPLIGPSGALMTRAFPMKKVAGEKLDHPHHRSLWFTHGSVNKVDFWSEAPGHGRIVETSRPTMQSGQALATLRTTDDWLSKDGQKICDDVRLVQIYSTTKARLLDFTITLRASEGPLSFGDTKEGMFGVRVATSMDVTSDRGGKIINADAAEDKDAWGKASRWVDYSGPVDGKVVGIAILNHPSSFRYPTTWHVRDYGLFAANPFGWHDFGRKERGDHQVPKGESITFRYRVVLGEGNLSLDDIEGMFGDYASPPLVVIE